MRVEELRIGNYVYDTDEKCYTTIELYDFKEEYFHLYEPIELTPEIMQKIKGIKQKEGSLGLYYYIEPYSILRFFFDGTQLVIIKKENGNIWIANKKYLHELQNLYFALTNEELQIDL